ncbi:hypothetical protein [Kushneria phosphatilytica]|uniref:Uncharacterized protein n=1 Tax=Kushneria phosphatilytica TaxID=657387 RepID=A0A1S1NX00_9GAMM|nr:hypothetical protein [Kushneria phosphatilytica]OHV10533.1 hypothetical protein BH688_09020 [Kushneria phosphatilytica]QEL11900.1 hypothetical protein FY550_12650 [Kushneria phosphatilytica]
MNSKASEPHMAPVVAILLFEQGGTPPGHTALARAVGERLVYELERSGIVELVLTPDQPPSRLAVLPHNTDYLLIARLRIKSDLPHIALTLISGADTAPLWHEALNDTIQSPFNAANDAVPRLATTLAAIIRSDFHRRLRSGVSTTDLAMRYMPLSGPRLPVRLRGRPNEAQHAQLIREANSWWAEFSGVLAPLSHLKGLEDIARLLARPGEPLHCLELTGRIETTPGAAILDERSRCEIGCRRLALQTALAEAEGMNDLGRAHALRSELDQLSEELSKALGLDGRKRRLGDAAERARSTVTWRIRHAIRRTTTVHPALGRHLANSVRTGLFCSYLPEREIQWRIRDLP